MRFGGKGATLAPLEPTLRYADPHDKLCNSIQWILWLLQKNSLMNETGASVRRLMNNSV